MDRLVHMLVLLILSLLLEGGGEDVVGGENKNDTSCVIFFIAMVLFVYGSSETDGRVRRIYQNNNTQLPLD